MQQPSIHRLFFITEMALTQLELQLLFPRVIKPLSILYLYRQISIGEFIEERVSGSKFYVSNFKLNFPKSFVMLQSHTPLQMSQCGIPTTLPTQVGVAISPW